MVQAAGRLGPARLRRLADLIERGEHPVVIAQSGLGFAEDVDTLLDALPRGLAPGYLRGFAAGLAHHEVQVETVWSGPIAHEVPVRATAQVLVNLVDRASKELLLMTYSAKPYEPLRDALAAAVRRKVRVAVVVETLQGAGSALQGTEPAAAFGGLGVELWHWPPGQREEGSKMHAKIAVGDRRELLVSSANLTQSGVAKNIEAGLLILGGATPLRAAEHIAALRSAGVLERL